MKSFKWSLVFMLLMLPLLACAGIQLPFGGDRPDSPADQVTSSEGGESASQDSQGGDQAVAAPGDIPLYPGARDFDAGSNPMMRAMLQPMIQQLESQYDSSAQVKFYSLPEGTTNTDVQTFYKENLAGLGWKEQSLEDQGQTQALTLAWLRNDQEVFIVSFMEMPQMEPMLFTVLATEK